MEELKPCPFCGGKPEITKHFKHDLYGLIHRCKVIGPMSWDFSKKEGHIKAWNTRTPEPPDSPSEVNDGL